MTKEAAEKKLKEFIDKNYEFCIGVRFSHLQYSKVMLRILIWEKLKL